MKLAALGIVMALAGSLGAEPAPPHVELKVGTEIRQSEIVGEASQFPAGKWVIAWTRAHNLAGTELEAVWQRDGVVECRADLKIKRDRFTTSSWCKVRPGAWTVEVSHRGKLLSRVAFSAR
jgi:hypothetical protein